METYNSVKDILGLKNYLKSQKENYEKVIVYNSANKDVSPYNFQRKYFAQLVKEQKQEIKHLKSKIIECDHLMDIYSTFPSKIILPFIARVISLFEKKEYIYEEFLLNMNIGIERYMATSYLMRFYAIYDSDYKKEKEKLEQKWESYYLIFQQNILGEKSLKDNYHKEIRLLNKSCLAPFFKNFPYLEQIVYNLIDRRLSEPTKDLQLIVNEELENLENKGVSLKRTY